MAKPRITKAKPKARAKKPVVKAKPRAKPRAAPKKKPAAKKPVAKKKAPPKKRKRAPVQKQRDAPHGFNEVSKARLDYTEELLATGMNSTKVSDAVQAKFGVSKRTAERYISKVYKRWEDEEPEERSALRARMRARLDNLLAKMLGETKTDIVTKEGLVLSVELVDGQTAVRVADRLAKLDGLDHAKKIEHSGKIETPQIVDLSGLTREEREMLRKLTNGKE